MNVISMQEFLAPIRKTLLVQGTPGDVFELFTAGLGSWWPLAAGHSVFGDACAGCSVEPRLGGAITETSASGERATWGRIVEWNPPASLAFTWFPGRTEDTAQVVAVRFIADPPATRVELEHRDWHRLGADAEQVREGYRSGWEHVLGTFGMHAARRARLPLLRDSAYPDLRAARFNLLISSDRETLFDLLATGEGMDRWFTNGAALEPRPGGAMVFRWGVPGTPDYLELEGQVEEWARPSRFVFRWLADAGHYDTTCEIDLVPQPEGTLVRLVEHGYAEGDVGLQDLLNRQGGWAQQLMRLKAFVEHGIML